MLKVQQMKRARRRCKWNDQTSLTLSREAFILDFHDPFRLAPLRPISPIVRKSHSRGDVTN